jgi:hypothetical protein
MKHARRSVCLQGMTKSARFALARRAAKLVFDEMTERMAEEGKHFPPEIMIEAMNKAAQAAIRTAHDKGLLEAVDLYVVAAEIAAKAASHFDVNARTKRRRRLSPLRKGGVGRLARASPQAAAGACPSPRVPRACRRAFALL